jgi:hypothetical protein
MRILVSIDDTDNIDSRGTGELATMIAADLETNGWGSSSYVTRHQLLVHPDIPYTSHNSAMCFTAEIDQAALPKIIAHASDFLSRESAVGSDPGLCVAVIDQLGDPDGLQNFGRRAKKEVLTKAEAYETARLLGVHLSEHGGTGQGIIGALAGAGLRLGGNDGRLKGWLEVATSNGSVSVRELLAHPHVNAIWSIEGTDVHDEDLVKMGEKAKTVLLDGMAVLLVSAAASSDSGATWQTVPRQQLKRY